MKDDMISRQAALDALGERPTVWTDDDDYALGERNQYDMDRLAIETVPSAQLAQDLPNGCTDTISRAAVGDALNRIEISRNASWYEFYQKALTAVGNLPSAQQWIPWDSGKLPKESGYYTVTVYDGAKRRVTYAKYQKRLKRWELTGARAYWRVLAWMPYIEPWEGGQDGV